MATNFSNLGTIGFVGGDASGQRGTGADKQDNRSKRRSDLLSNLQTNLGKAQSHSLLSRRQKRRMERAGDSQNYRGQGGRNRIGIANFAAGGGSAGMLAGPGYFERANEAVSAGVTGKDILRQAAKNQDDYRFALSQEASQRAELRDAAQADFAAGMQVLGDEESASRFDVGREDRIKAQEFEQGIATTKSKQDTVQHDIAVKEANAKLKTTAEKKAADDIYNKMSSSEEELFGGDKTMTDEDLLEHYGDTPATRAALVRFRSDTVKKEREGKAFEADLAAKEAGTGVKKAEVDVKKADIEAKKAGTRKTNIAALTAEQTQEASVVSNLLRSKGITDPSDPRIAEEFGEYDFSEEAQNAALAGLQKDLTTSESSEDAILRKEAKVMHRLKVQKKLKLMEKNYRQNYGSAPKAGNMTSAQKEHWSNIMKQREKLRLARVGRVMDEEKK